MTASQFHSFLILFRFHSEKRWQRKLGLVSIVMNIPLKPSLCQKLMLSDIECYTISVHFPEIRCSRSLTENIFTETQGSWDTWMGLPVAQATWNSTFYKCCLSHCPQQLHWFPVLLSFPQKAWRKKENKTKNTSLGKKWKCLQRRESWGYSKAFGEANLRLPGRSETVGPEARSPARGRRLAGVEVVTVGRGQKCLQGLEIPRLKRLPR